MAPLIISLHVSWILKKEIKIKLCIAPNEIAYVQYQKKKNNRYSTFVVQSSRTRRHFLEWSVADSMQNNKGSWASKYEFTVQVAPGRRRCRAYRKLFYRVHLLL